MKIHGRYWPIGAEVVQIDSMSAHADAAGLLKWAKSVQGSPKKFFVNHGEISPAEALRRALAETLHIDVVVPEIDAAYELDDVLATAAHI